MRGQGRDVLTRENNLSTVALQVARQLRHQTGLACPIGTNQRVDFSRLHVQRDMIRRPQGPKLFDQVIHLKQGSGAHVCPPLLTALRLSKPARPLGANKTTASRNQPT